MSGIVQPDRLDAHAGARILAERHQASESMGKSVMESPVPRLDIRVLGSLSARVNDADIELGGTKQRRLLTVLLLRANRAVAASEIIDGLWPDNPPRTARKNLHVYVCELRKMLADRIRTTAGGYVFGAGAAELDLLRFKDLTVAGRRAARNGDPAAAADLLGAAVRLWRGRPAAELWEPGEMPHEASRLWEHFATAYEDWIDATIALGRNAEALESLDAIDGSVTFRERLAVSRMRALSRCGRTLEALSFYEDKRQYLAREYGIDPSPVLQAMHRDLLSPRSREVPATIPEARPHAIPAVMHQLPRRIPDLVGRAEPLRTIAKQPAGVSIIWGRVGAGKTSLAIHAAHQLAPDYPDGSLFVRSRTADGRRKDGAAATSELLRAVGLSAAAPADRDGASALWRSWTIGRKILLVLDDVPGEDYVDDLLPSSPDSLTLVTSRSRLSGLEADLWVEVADFTEEEAATLLSRLMGARRVAAEHGAVRRIIACCGSSPLAIRIIAGKLATMPRLPLAEFADRLTATDPLAELVSGKTSVADRYAAWHESLPADGKAAARCLAGLSPDPFTLVEARQALAFAGQAPDRAFELLLELGVLSTAAAVDEVTAHADDTIHAEMFHLPPLVRRFLLRDSV
jgi:DNA-binding SARP family transcriptional activator